MPHATDVAVIRGALDADALHVELRRRGSSWPSPRVVDSVESTNAVLAAAARDGAPEGLVLLAETQTQGRGRLDRTWDSPRGAGLTLSVLLRPAPPPSTWGWLPIAAGLALHAAVGHLSTLPLALKWPNDLLLGPDQGKAAGILAGSVDGAVVLGVGVNVSTTVDELPEGATSLLVEGAGVSREALLVELLLALEWRYAAWTRANGDAVLSGLMAAYRKSCSTIGRTVSIQLPHGKVLNGIAAGIDPSGGLQVRTQDGSLATVVAADVVHVRPAD